MGRRRPSANRPCLTSPRQRRGPMEIDSSRLQMTSTLYGSGLVTTFLGVVVIVPILWLSSSIGLMGQRGAVWVHIVIVVLVIPSHFFGGAVSSFIFIRYKLLQDRVKRLRDRIAGHAIVFELAIAELNEILDHVGAVNRGASLPFSFGLISLVSLAISNAAIFLLWNSHPSFAITSALTLLGQPAFAADAIHLTTALEELRTTTLSVETVSARKTPAGTPVLGGGAPKYRW